MSGTIVPARFDGCCPICDRRWTKGAAITHFGDRSEHVGRWGHPACVAADDMGLPSVDALREHIARLRSENDAADVVNAERRA